MHRTVFGCAYKSRGCGSKHPTSDQFRFSAAAVDFLISLLPLSTLTGLGDFAAFFIYSSNCSGTLGCEGAWAGQFDVTYTYTPNSLAVRLPAALPMFATGLGVLGLLGWRRKRKLAAGTVDPQMN